MTLLVSAATYDGTVKPPPPPKPVPPNKSEHRHKDPVTGKVNTSVSGKHTHADLETRLANVEARLAALEP